MPTKNKLILITTIILLIIVFIALFNAFSFGDPVSKLLGGQTPKLDVDKTPPGVPDSRWDNELPILSINEALFKVEIADTPEKRTLGLSNHIGLKDDEGMLFIFEKPDIYGFWMKDMAFPIDIIWINEDFEVIGLSENLLPTSYPQAFYPPSEALFVLEINANLAKKLNIRGGDQVNFK